MEAAVSLEEIGVRFLVPQKSGRSGGHRGRRSQVEHWGLRAVTLDIWPGETLGVIGHNGAGKTTLLRTISGIYRPDEGKLRIQGQVTPLLSLSSGMKPRLSGWENIELSGVLLGLSRSEVRNIARAVAEFSGVGKFLDAPLRVYSSGMRARLAFGLAAFAKPDVLVLDDVMSAGDREFREKSTAMIEQLLSEAKTVVISSHDIERLSGTCDRLLYLEEGRVAKIGAPQEVAGYYLGRRAYEKTRYAPA